ncbi:MAG: hypothetical protein JXA95_15280 [Spirochaetales bacterium]|nr:hypothetical protein [Spirochaetales bacterium]
MRREVTLPKQGYGFDTGNFDEGAAEIVEYDSATGKVLFTSGMEGYLVYDSGSLFERFTADFQPDFINCSNDNLAIDDRSPKKGPEPEAIAFGEIEGRPLLFVGLERFGGFFVFAVSDPTAPEMMLYHTDRNFSAALNEDREYEDTSFNNTGDLGPEGFHIVSADDSLTGKALLITGSEVSGTVSVYQMEF